jgi:hypothetical protein
MHASRIATTHCRWHRGVMGHVVIGHIDVLQVLLLILCSDVFERQGCVVPMAVMLAITIHREWLKQ